MKYPVFALFGIALAGGCFNPNIRNGGFACTGSQDGECPQGFTCVNGRCVDNPGSIINNPQRDLAMSLPVDMAMATMMANDMAHAMMSQDMSMPAKADMAQPPPPDMAKNACAHDYCTTGAYLNANCDPCVAAICTTGNDPYCCNPKHSWDYICVDDVSFYCTASQQCP